MKNLKYLFLSFMVALFFASCEDEDKLIYDADSAVAPSIQSPSDNSSITLSMDNEDDKVAFSWSAADLGVSVETTYTVELSADENFTTVSDLIETSETSDTVTISDINAALLSLDFIIDETATVYCRIVTYISDNVENLISETVSYTVIPYNAVVAYPEIYLPGAYQGWSPGATNGILYSYNFDAIYENIVYIYEEGSTAETTEFKVSEDTGWAVNYGGTLSEGSDGSYSASLVSGGDNLKIAPGCYDVTVDLDELTITLVSADHWGIIGSSVSPYDWSVDEDMFYNGSTQQWEITTDLVAGLFKFRANNAWTLNYGLDDDGNFSSGAGNIPIESDGTYFITLDLNNITYSVTEIN